MKNYVDQIWGWHEDDQRQYFSDKFNPKDLSIIVNDGKSVGVVEVYNRESEIFIADLKITREYQNKRIGTAVLDKIIADSIENKKPISLQVLKVNPAQELYKRLGFKVMAVTKTHVMMKRNIA